MKYILILLMVLSLQADKILIPTVSHHSVDNLYGEKINSLNYGLGYQKEYNYKNFDTMLTALMLKDSFSNIMTSITYGVRYNTEYKSFNFNTGLDFGVAHRKMLHEEIVDDVQISVEQEYKIVPIAFLPSASISKGRWSLEIIHIPEIKIKNVEILSATLFLVGYKID